MQADLEAHGLGTDALGIIANVLEHEGGPPAHTPPIVEAILRDPLAGVDASALFTATVPADLQQFAILPPASPTDFNAALDRYVAELAEAQADLMAAVAPFDEDGLLREIGEGISLARVLALHRSVDLERLAKARTRFLAATSRFAAEARVSAIPPPQRFESAIGTVVIGSPGADRHPSGAALIVDPGGDDLYERAPAKDGAIAVVIDLAGNDRYTGSDVAVHALSAIVDAAGDDSYSASGAGIATALAGVSVLLDLDGHDQYESGVMGQAAALYGWAALIDAAGDDRYRVKAFGQGYGGTGGVGLLWDRAGNDTYLGEGLPDPFDRGGGVGFTQGAAAGWREGLAGGAGILRDESGDDRYEAQMFAQGTGYFYGLGLLWDRSGNDRYAAVRYGQGNGVHQAAGLLDDEAGDDRYSMTVGVGQGMGLDLAVGALIDRAGNDEYRAASLAQGSATANGFGLLVDEAGANSFEMSGDPRAWGRAQWLRGLPSVGVILRDPQRSVFTRRNGAYAPQYYAKHEVEPGPDCKNREAVRAILADPAQHLGAPELPCALQAATVAQAEAIWKAVDAALALQGTPLNSIALALAQHPGPPALVEKVSAILKNHPHCAARSLWASTWASAEEASAALSSPCWRLKAAALERLRALGVAPRAGASTPVFLRPDSLAQ